MRWLDQLVGFGAGGTGIMVSGGSVANLHGIACAVVDTERTSDPPSGARHRLTMYVSREGHLSMRKAAQLLGLTHEHVRVLDIDAERRLRPAALRQALKRLLRTLDARDELRHLVTRDHLVRGDLLPLPVVPADEHGFVE